MSGNRPFSGAAESHNHPWGRVSIAPAYAETPNSFPRLFARSIADQGIEVRDFSWAIRDLCASRVAILHWPTPFFTNPPQGREQVRTRLKLGRLRFAKMLTGTKLVWVAHNLSPHDKQAEPSSITGAFLRLLDGVVYLSNASRKAVLAQYPPLRNVPGLVTVHGHYRSESIAPPVPRQPPGSPARLLFFGQVRRYKNIERLLACVRQCPRSEVTLRVTGLCKEDDLREHLVQVSGDAPHIELDLRSASIAEAELEAIVDASDAIVLPYRHVLNSGSAMYALSRNRPVLSARMGSLPELQEKVGGHWVFLYEGELSKDALLHFVSALRTEPPCPAPDLSEFDWHEIGRRLAEFLRCL